MEKGLENDISDIFNSVSQTFSFFGASVRESIETLFDSPKQLAPTEDDNLDEWTLLDHTHNQSQIKLRLSTSSEDDDDLGEGEYYDQQAELPDDYELVQEITSRLSKTRIDVASLSILVAHRGASPTFRASVYQLLLGFLSPWPHSWSTIPSMKQGFYKKYKMQYLGSGTVPKDARKFIRKDLKRVASKIKWFAAPDIFSLLERASFICMKECLLDIYPKGLATLSVPFLYSLFEELRPTLASTPDQEFTFTPDESEGIESKLFWMMYIFCEDHKAKLLLENQLTIISTIEEMLSSANPQLFSHLRSNQINFNKRAPRWITSFLLPLFRRLPLFMLLWDKYMTNVHRLSAFHACVCSSVLLYKADHILSLPASELQKFVSHPIQETWNYEEMLAFLQFVDKNSESFSIPAC